MGWYLDINTNDLFGNKLYERIPIYHIGNTSNRFGFKSKQLLMNIREDVNFVYHSFQRTRLNQDPVTYVDFVNGDKAKEIYLAELPKNRTLLFHAYDLGLYCSVGMKLNRR